jgi:hypothetical protein
MSSRTLKDDLASDFENVFLNENEFSEWVTYHPAYGGPSRRILVNVTKPKADVNDQGDIEARDESISVECRKTETGTKGGVACPVRDGSRADTLVRDGETDRYAFTGTVENETPHSWKLLFRRLRPTRIGTAQRQQ